MRIIRACARLLFATIFVTGGWDVAKEPGPTRIQMAASIGVPQPEAAVRANGIVMVTAGLALALGFFPRFAAAILAASLAPTTVAGHPFWKENDPMKRNGQRVHFLKNLAMIGGLLLLATDSPRLHQSRS